MSQGTFGFAKPPDPTKPPDTQGMSRRTDPATSHKAAKEFVASGARESHQSLILDVIRETPGETFSEIVEVLGVEGSVVNKRLPEMCRKGMIRKGADRACRTNGKEKATYWPVEGQG